MTRPNWIFADLNLIETVIDANTEHLEEPGFNMFHHIFASKFSNVFKHI